MGRIGMSEEINQQRRGFFGTAAMAVAAIQLGMIGPARAQRVAAKMPAIKPGTNSSFGALKQINAGILNVGYAEAGPANGLVVVLLHGWPYDIHSFVDTAPLLASAGYRVIVPYLRGYGTTGFLSSSAARNGQPSALAVDLMALMDALRIEKATIAGFYWGALTANIFAALWPCRRRRRKLTGIDLPSGKCSPQVADGEIISRGSRRTPSIVEGRGHHGLCYQSQRDHAQRRCGRRHAAPLGLARRVGHDGHEVRLRQGALRRLHRAH